MLLRETERRMARRIRRLTLVSAIALGIIWWLSTGTTYAAMPTRLALALGWLVMPTVLLARLRLPRARLGLALPSTLVTVALAAISIAAWRDGSATAPGWSLLLLGITLGDLLGGWLWFGVLPVPPGLRDLGSVARWLLILAHVGPLVAGLAWLLLAPHG